MSIFWVWNPWQPVKTLRKKGAKEGMWVAMWEQDTATIKVFVTGALSETQQMSAKNLLSKEERNLQNPVVESWLLTAAILERWVRQSPCSEIDNNQVCKRPSININIYITSRFPRLITCFNEMLSLHILGFATIGILRGRGLQELRILMQCL